MPGRRLHPLSPTGALIDQVIESYVVWREACEAVEESYGVWRRAPSDQSAATYADFVATLNREELAADEYQFMVEQARQISHEIRHIPAAQRRSAGA